MKRSANVIDRLQNPLLTNNCMTKRNRVDYNGENPVEIIDFWWSNYELFVSADKADPQGCQESNNSKKYLKKNIKGVSVEALKIVFSNKSKQRLWLIANTPLYNQPEAMKTESNENKVCLPYPVILASEQTVDSFAGEFDLRMRTNIDFDSASCVEKELLPSDTIRPIVEHAILEAVKNAEHESSITGNRGKLLQETLQRLSTAKPEIEELIQRYRSLTHLLEATQQKHYDIDLEVSRLLESQFDCIIGQPGSDRDVIYGAGQLRSVVSVLSPLTGKKEDDVTKLCEGIMQRLGEGPKGKQQAVATNDNDMAEVAAITNEKANVNLVQCTTLTAILMTATASNSLILEALCRAAAIEVLLDYGMNSVYYTPQVANECIQGVSIGGRQLLSLGPRGALCWQTMCSTAMIMGAGPAFTKTRGVAAIIRESGCLRSEEARRIRAWDFGTVPYWVVALDKEVCATVDELADLSGSLAYVHDLLDFVSDVIEGEIMNSVCMQGSPVSIPCVQDSTGEHVLKLLKVGSAGRAMLGGVIIWSISSARHRVLGAVALIDREATMGMTETARDRCISLLTKGELNSKSLERQDIYARIASKMSERGCALVANLMLACAEAIHKRNHIAAQHCQQQILDMAFKAATQWRQKNSEIILLEALREAAILLFILDLSGPLTSIINQTFPQK
ncbi:hypothetical protein K7432_012765 [Basidiobolus ranarum]|uniref:Uncharacterized protein n=1 Tax=Basidiobolus ranarum TaxID=34480 RepID=A0ABR2VRS5_9FUNG